MYIGILGLPEVRTDDGRSYSPRGGKQRLLLSLLLPYSPRLASVDRLIGAVWGDHPPGRPHEALSVYQDYCRVLSEELGADPSPALRQMEGAILRYEARSWEVDGRPEPPGGTPARRRRRRGRSGRAGLRAAPAEHPALPRARRRPVGLRHRGLESANHPILEHEPAFEHWIRGVHRFLAEEVER